jgi:ethanolamine utilization protein EutA
LAEFRSNSLSAKDSLLSVGIDIGTTTTHLVLSSLSFTNKQSFGLAPKLEIHSREILYQSPVVFTPLTASGDIDAQGVEKIIQDFYQSLGISPNEIDTGALIVTGESAARRNAQEVVAALSNLAGALVAQSAGPHLESALAAKGNGLLEKTLYKNHPYRLSVDIGGGTSNFALLKDGEILATSCLNVGGRFLTFNSQGELSRISKTGHILAEHLKLKLSPQPSCRELEELAQLAARLVRLEMEAWLTKEIPQELEALHEKLMLTKSLKDACVEGADSQGKIATISGGIGELLKLPRQTLANQSGKYFDLGEHLARALSFELEHSLLEHEVKENSIRSTVIGAGAHAVELTGSTINYQEEQLPLKNLAVFPWSTKASLEHNQNELKNFIERELESTNKKQACLFLQDLSKTDLTYKYLSQLSQELSLTIKSSQLEEPYVVALAPDGAMALGILLQGLLKDKRIITIDGITAHDGDFIDIGKPIFQVQDPTNTSLPVVIKTLVFYK